MSCLPLINLLEFYVTDTLEYQAIKLMMQRVILIQTLFAQTINISQNKCFLLRDLQASTLALTDHQPQLWSVLRRPAVLAYLSKVLQKTTPFMICLEDFNDNNRDIHQKTLRQNDNPRNNHTGDCLCQTTLTSYGKDCTAG